MNDAQRNAIREADNYLKAAGLPTYSSITTSQPAQAGEVQVCPLQRIEAERDQLRAEVERLKPNADRYEWLRDDLDSDWSICKWGDDSIYGAGYYRPDHLPVVADAMIDHARTTHKS